MGLLLDHVFSKNLSAVGPEMPGLDFLSSCDLIVFAIPTQSMRSVLSALDLKNVSPLPLLVFVNKGIEQGSNSLPLEVIEDVCGPEIANVATVLVRLSTISLSVTHVRADLVLDLSQSGPSFSQEIVQRMPTQVSVASHSVDHAERTGTASVILHHFVSLTRLAFVSSHLSQTSFPLLVSSCALKSQESPG